MTVAAKLTIRFDPIKTVDLILEYVTNNPDKLGTVEFYKQLGAIIMKEARVSIDVSKETIFGENE